MPKGRCTNFDLPCPKYVNEEIIEVAEGADFVCPNSECGRELMPIESDGNPLKKLKKAGKPALFGALALLLLGGVGYGGFALFSGGGSEEAPSAAATDASARPASNAVRTALQEDLSGYEMAGEPTFATSDGTGRFIYDVTLRPTEARYEVPVVDFPPPESWDETARDLSQHLILSDALPAGKVYDADAKSKLDGTADRVEAQWTGRFEANGNAWQYAGDGRLDLREATGETNLPEADDGHVIVTAGALEEAVQEQEAAVQAFEKRWQRVGQNVEQRRASLAQSLPPPCTKNTDPLIREITRLSSNRCPSLSGEERKQCYLKVQKLNSKLGDCETRNQVRAEARRGMSGKVARFRREQVDALREKLKQTAADHNQSLSG